MGIIVPEDMPLTDLANESERRVVTALREGLDDRWLILPDVSFSTPDQDRQLDLVLIHERHGVVDLEIKGHAVSIERGRWYAHGREMERQPPAQAKGNAYALRDLLRDEIPGLRHLHVSWGVALPNTRSMDGKVGSGIAREQIVISPQLDDPNEALLDVVSQHIGGPPLTDEQIEAIVDLLRPNVDFAYDPRARQAWARTRLEALSEAQIRTLESLDANRRVVALGAAGTGKTGLALAWARRAFLRDERVLLTCFNEPLAEHLAERAPDDDSVVVGPFLRLALTLDGMPPIEEPPDAGRDWWDGVALGHLLTNWHRVTARFDTIVVDEAQDLSPAWLALLIELLDPDGPRRVLLLADPAQAIYERGFTAPRAEDGWTHVEMEVNCRNALQIGRLLRRRLRGAAAPGSAPDAVDLRFVEVSDGLVDQDGDEQVDRAAVVAKVRTELDRLILDEERDPTTTMVLTFSSALRDELVEAADLVPWERRSEGIVGQTVHRAKGLEADTVVLVADRAPVPDHLLYVGVSRAVSELIVVGPPELGVRLDLDQEPTT